MLGNIMLRCSLLLALVRWGVGDIAWSQINFYPDNTEKCKETEITVIFDVEGGFAVGDQITFYLGGMTRGNCENANGAAISDGLVLLGSPSGLEEWSGEYVEGTVDGAYRDSELTLTALAAVNQKPGYRHTVVIDPSNDIRPNCGISENSPYMMRGVNATCYMTDTSLQFRPALPKLTSQITVGFRPAMHLYANYEVRVNMAGWTSGEATGTMGPDLRRVIVRDDLAVVGDSTLFRGRWREGCCYEQHKAGFRNSTLILTVRSGVTITAGTTVSLVIPDHQLRAQCGMPGPYERTKFEVRGPHTSIVNKHQNYTIAAPATVASADAIGDGCKALDYCSGNGACDHCTSTCSCVDRHGTFDNSQTNFNCEEINGHGTCATMRALAMLDEALPLTSRENRSYAHSNNQRPRTWDADRIFGCVCDSSWKVGLEANETQTPEYFGADCSLMHCPSGDDPMTRRDETDCFNVTADGGYGVGKVGNKCHVDCSNRGLCDHESGLCKCFAGFYGPACDTINVKALQEEL
ncbi:hypothetical protein JL722_2276 [Aureococcus anophagefferens]|nr:hypothetical protein JL722_2276 [Aureococcus anophagefferens]